MKPKTVFVVVSVLFVAVMISILFIDLPLATWIGKNQKTWELFFFKMTSIAEILTGFPVSKYLPAIIFIVLGIGFHIAQRNITIALNCYFIGLTFFFTRIIAGVLKNVFLRIRPDAFLEGHDQVNTFFLDGGNSFPSGHAAHFWGLFLPLAVIFPKYRILLLSVPVMISIARVAVNHHYLSDVLASTSICFCICLALKKLTLDRLEAKTMAKKIS